MDGGRSEPFIMGEETGGRSTTCGGCTAWVPALLIAGALGDATWVLHIYSLGPFIEPLQAEFGWTHAKTAAGLTISAPVNATVCIPIGMLVGRIGPRRWA